MALMAKLLIVPALIAFLYGSRAAKWLLIVEGVMILGVIIWLTAACFGSKGFGVVALVATLKGLIYVIPLGLLGSAGILAGWGLRRLAGLPPNGSLLGMTRRF